MLNDELVLCFPASLMLEDTDVNDWPAANYRLSTILSTPGLAAFRPRSEVEKDCNWLQVIPYCFIHPVHDFRRVLVYRRTKKSSESRLNNTYSLGFGGHINYSDALHDLHIRAADSTRIMRTCLQRELDEEIQFERKSETAPVIHIPQRCSFMLYDSTNEVSKCHLGVIYHMAVRQFDCVTLKDPSLDDLRCLTIDQLKSPEWDGKLESWAKLLVQKLDTLTA